APGVPVPPQPQAPADPLAAARTPDDVARVLDEILPQELRLEGRITTLDRGLAKLDPAGRTQVLIHALDTATLAPPRDLTQFQTAVIERLAGLPQVPAASARLATILDATSPRFERFATLRALAANVQNLTSELKDKIGVIANDHENSNLEMQ